MISTTSIEVNGRYLTLGIYESQDDVWHIYLDSADGVDTVADIKDLTLYRNRNKSAAKIHYKVLVACFRQQFPDHEAS